MKKIVLMIAVLLFVVLTGSCMMGAGDKLIQENFADPPKDEGLQDVPNGVEPSLNREEEILLSCHQAGIEDPILPKEENGKEEVHLYQKTISLALEGEDSCRVTYFVYEVEDNVCGLWIEACLVIDNCAYKNDTTTIFSALTTQEQIKEEMLHSLSQWRENQKQN